MAKRSQDSFLHAWEYNQVKASQTATITLCGSVNLIVDSPTFPPLEQHPQKAIFRHTQFRP